MNENIKEILKNKYGDKFERKSYSVTEIYEISSLLFTKQPTVEDEERELEQIKQQLSSTIPAKQPTPTDEIEVIEYEGFLYWYQHKLAKDKVDICLGTKDPKKYCNGFYLYSTKDPGSGKEFVVIGTNNPEFYNEWMRDNKPVEQPQVDWDEIEWIKTEINLLMSKNTYPDNTDLKKLWHKVNDFIRKNKLQPKEEEVKKKPILICGYCKKKFYSLIPECSNCGNKL